MGCSGARVSWRGSVSIANIQTLNAYRNIPPCRMPPNAALPSKDSKIITTKAAAHAAAPLKNRA